MPSTGTVLPTGSLRIAVFTHDTFGLGHVRRCLHIVRSLAARRPDSSILFLTGSPALHLFRSLPPNVDMIKIPTVVKTGAKAFRPPHLQIPIVELAGLRRGIMLEAVRGFGPDVFLVDNFPLGSQGELYAILQELHRTRCRTVLGLRDVLDTPEAVRADWERQGMHEILDRYYDRILVYGMREVFDVGESYGLAPQVSRKVRYCGYVTDDGPVGDVDASGVVPTPFVMATGGGGGDAFPLLQTFVRALPSLPELPVLIVTGPLMSETLRTKLAKTVNGRSSVIVRDYLPDLRGYLARAAAVVSMCGYNTAAEIVATRARAVVAPRTWQYGEHSRRHTAGAEGEQLLRARALARLGLVDCIEPGDLNPERLAEHVRTLLGAGAPPHTELDLGGRERVVDHLLETNQSLSGGSHGCD
jgi:predicted glycosyltransferase